MQEYGIEIAVDDFGTGYSSMAYLKELPAKTLKIDRTFVRGVPENPNDARILKALIVFGKTLDLTIIVEGVESLAQAAFCRTCGADYLQGYLFAKPCSQEDFECYLESYTADYWRQALNCGDC